jgi:competence transcription factor ComK
VHNVKAIKWTSATTLKATLTNDTSLDININTQNSNECFVSKANQRSYYSYSLVEYQDERSTSRAKAIDFLRASALGVAFVATMIGYAAAASCP